MHIKKVIPLLFSLFAFTTTACSNRNNEKPATLKVCSVGEKTTDRDGNSFQINNVILNDSELYVQGDFTFINFLFFDNIQGYIVDSEEESKKLFTINVERSSTESSIDFQTKPLSCSGSYVLVFDIGTIKIQNIETININFGIDKPNYTETRFVIFGNDILEERV